MHKINRMTAMKGYYFAQTLRMDFKNYHDQFLYKIRIPTYKEIREQMANAKHE